MVEFDLFSNIDNYIIIAIEQLQKKKKSKTNNKAMINKMWKEEEKVGNKVIHNCIKLIIIIKAKKQCSNNIILEIHQKVMINQIEMEQKSMIKEN